MKIGELAKRSGLTAHTIRYYERIGLLPRADRNGSGHRDYDVSVLTWIEFLGRLKATGMPISRMLRYAELRARGSGTEPERRALLVMHRETVRSQIGELQAALSVLDTKIADYGATAMRNENNDAEPVRHETRTRAARARSHRR